MTATSLIVIKFGATRTNLPVTNLGALSMTSLVQYERLEKERKLTIFLVRSVRVQVFITYVGVIHCVPIGDSCEEPSRILGERVKVKPVYHKSKELLGRVSNRH